MQFLVVKKLSLRGSNEQSVNQGDFDSSFDNRAGYFVNMVKFNVRQGPQVTETAISLH